MRGGGHPRFQKGHSGTPADHPDTPRDHPDTPAGRPDTPGDRPDTPGDRPDTPGDHPDTPGDRPDTPRYRRDTRGGRQVTPGDYCCCPYSHLLYTKAYGQPPDTPEGHPESRGQPESPQRGGVTHGFKKVNLESSSGSPNCQGYLGNPTP